MTGTPDEPVVASRLGGERGSAGVWVMLLVCLLAGATVLATGLADVAVTRHRAASAADLAALAAAGTPDLLAVTPGPTGCPAAERVATLHGARLIACTVDGSGVVDVVAGAPLSPWVGRLVAFASGDMIRVSARAGPPPLEGWP